MGDHRVTGQTMDRLQASQDSKPPEDIPKPETILVGPFELVKEKIMAVPGLLRLIAVLLLFIMFICAVVGKGAAGAFKFQIFCWVLFTPLTVVFCLKDWHPDGPPEMIGNFEFSLARLASMAVGCLFVLIGSLAAWSAHEGVGAQQAAGAFGALAGICYGVLTFFAFQMRKEELEKRANEENPEKKAEAEGEAAPPVDRSQKPNTVSGGQGGGMGYRVRDINEIPSMEPPIPERSGFNTLASRQNTMNLNAGDRIGYRGQTQYNEKYDEDGPDIMDNPQPLAHTTYNPRELELNVNGLDHDAFTEYGDRDIMTLPRDRTLGHGEGVPYGVPEQPGAYMSGPTDNF